MMNLATNWGYVSIYILFTILLIIYIHHKQFCTPSKTVIVFGETKAGKTSMINALLNLNNPVNNAAKGCTFQSTIETVGSVGDPVGKCCILPFFNLLL